LNSTINYFYFDFIEIMISFKVIYMFSSNMEFFRSLDFWLFYKNHCFELTQGSIWAPIAGDHTKGLSSPLKDSCPAKGLWVKTILIHYIHIYPWYSRIPSWTPCWFRRRSTCRYTWSDGGLANKLKFNHLHSQSHPINHLLRSKRIN